MKHFQQNPNEFSPANIAQICAQMIDMGHHDKAAMLLLKMQETGWSE